MAPDGGTIHTAWQSVLHKDTDVKTRKLTYPKITLIKTRSAVTVCLKI
jgi:hypothetical protein